MPRTLWSGTLSFGLVSIPVSLVSAKEEEPLSFHLLDRRDHARIGYRTINQATGKEVRLHGQKGEPPDLDELQRLGAGMGGRSQELGGSEGPLSGSTSIAPYSFRAREDATVAMPIRWEDALKIPPDHFTLDRTLRHLRKRQRDPWAGYFRDPVQNLLEVRVKGR